MVKLNFSELQPKIEKELNQNYGLFTEANLAFVEKHSNDFVRVAFENLIPKHPPFDLNSEELIKSFRSIQNLKCPIRFGLKKGDGRHWWKNEVLIDLDLPEITDWGTPSFFEYRKWRDNLEYKCQDEFFIDGSINEVSEYLNSWPLFEDIKSVQSGIGYNKNSWIEILRYLLTNLFPSFPYSSGFSYGKVRRHLKQLGEQAWLGFEYDETFIMQEIKQGNLSMSNYFNLLIIDSSFDSRQKPSTYYYKNNQSVISLGILGNPFFYPPCYPITGFTAVEKYRREQKSMSSYLLLTDWIREMNECEMELKKHSYFYLVLLSLTSEPYLKYLELSIIQSLEIKV